MRSLLLFFVCLTFPFTEMFAQQISLVPLNYYKKDTTYVMEGYSYRCEGKTGNVSLYNAENKWANERQVYKSTGKVFDFGFGEVEKYNPIIDSYAMDIKVLNIVDYAFTKDFVKTLEDYEKLNVVMYLSPETGKVEEVKFWFVYLDPFATIPISTYRNIELKLKEQISYTPSEIGKQLNYIMLSLMRRPVGAHPAPDSSLELIE